jgi:hypothetical protein
MNVMDRRKPFTDEPMAGELPQEVYAPLRAMKRRYQDQKLKTTAALSERDTIAQELRVSRYQLARVYKVYLCSLFKMGKRSRVGFRRQLQIELGIVSDAEMLAWENRMNAELATLDGTQ